MKTMRWQSRNIELCEFRPLCRKVGIPTDSLPSELPLLGFNFGGWWGSEPAFARAMLQALINEPAVTFPRVRSNVVNEVNRPWRGALRACSSTVERDGTQSGRNPEDAAMVTGFDSLPCPPMYEADWYFRNKKELEHIRTQQKMSGMWNSEGIPFGDPAYKVGLLEKKYNPPKGSGLNIKTGEFMLP